ncbi:MAG: EMC3/TMCO1 family protein [Candidatus Woesearchaeota archaeon]
MDAVSIFEVIRPIVSPINIILFPLLDFSPLLALLCISVVASAFITLINKYFVDQHVLKELKNSMRKLQKRMRAQRDNISKLKKTQKELFELQFQLMKFQIKPMFIGSLPLLLVFGWIVTHAVFEPIQPDSDFTVRFFFFGDQEFEHEALLSVNSSLLHIQNMTSSIQHYTHVRPFLFNRDVQMAEWQIESDGGGLFELQFQYQNYTFEREVLLTNTPEYITPAQPVRNDSIRGEFRVENEPRVFFNLGFWPFRDVGAIGLYIIFQILFALIFRRLFKLA